MNIIEAVKSGKKYFRRPSFTLGYWAKNSNEIAWLKYDRHGQIERERGKGQDYWTSLHGFTAEDILADDWEVKDE